jgi:hypothetical protein
LLFQIQALHDQYSDAANESQRFKYVASHRVCSDSTWGNVRLIASSRVNRDRQEDQMKYGDYHFFEKHGFSKLRPFVLQQPIYESDS